MVKNCVQEKEKLIELRSLVSDLVTPFYDTDFNLIRWLQGFDYDLNRVVPKLRHHLRFRQSCWNLDILPTERDWKQESCYKWGLLGESGKGDNTLIYVSQVGKEDALGCFRRFCATDMLHSLIFDQERMFRAVMDQETKTGKQSALILIIDLEGMKLDSQLLEIIRGPMKVYNVMPDHYVELFRHIIVVNAPTVFYYIWSIVKPLMPESTRNHVSILGSNWKEKILKFASPNVLPERWGSPFSAYLPLPQKVHESEYSKVSINDFDNVQTVHVRPGKCELIAILIENQNDVIKFGYQADGDHGFGLFYADNPQETDTLKMEMVFPQFNKIGHTTIPVTDQLECNKSGCYKLWFSNEHAWWHVLKVEYFINIQSDDKL